MQQWPTYETQSVVPSYLDINSQQLCVCLCVRGTTVYEWCSFGSPTNNDPGILENLSSLWIIKQASLKKKKKTPQALLFTFWLVGCTGCCSVMYLLYDLLLYVCLLFDGGQMMALPRHQGFVWAEVQQSDVWRNKMVLTAFFLPFSARFSVSVFTPCDAL